MSRIIVTTMGSLGDLHPKIGLAVALRNRGHDVVFATHPIYQGRTGTTVPALRAGRPTLVMPYSYDQPDNAARVARLGTSRTIDIA